MPLDIDNPQETELKDQFCWYNRVVHFCNGCMHLSVQELMTLNSFAAEAHLGRHHNTYLFWGGLLQVSLGEM